MLPPAKVDLDQIPPLDGCTCTRRVQHTGSLTWAHSPLGLLERMALTHPSAPGPRPSGLGTLSRPWSLSSTFTTKLLSSKSGLFLLYPGFFHPGDLRAIYKVCLQFRVSDLPSSQRTGIPKDGVLGSQTGPLTATVTERETWNKVTVLNNSFQ